MNAGRSPPLVMKILFVRIPKDHIGAIARLVLQGRITSVLVIMLLSFFLELSEARNLNSV